MSVSPLSGDSAIVRDSLSKSRSSPTGATPSPASGRSNLDKLRCVTTNCFCPPERGVVWASTGSSGGVAW